MSPLEQRYNNAREQYAILGVDTDAALERLNRIPISLHCWQGDDVGGFENQRDLAGSGLAATGNYPGRARNGDELRSDLDMAYHCIPGRHRLNLHAIYAEPAEGEKVERNALEPRHFSKWLDWAKSSGIGLDFNPSFFAHPKASSGFTLTHLDPAIRQFWVEHGIVTRNIAAHFGRELGTASVNNVWIPDGFKDEPVGRKERRELLIESLDKIFAEPLDHALMLDAVEPKLFGIGVEACTIGSHEFYLAYALKHQVMLCLDAGHYHPTEVISEKLSSVLSFLDEILLHVSRGVRWDSDHVVVLSDELRAIAQELVRGDYLRRTHIGLDYFDASINRVAAWVIGTRAMLKALLIALLEPIKTLHELENSGDYTARLALLEDAKALPWGDVWAWHCAQNDTAGDGKWLEEIRSYEKKVLAGRS